MVACVGRGKGGRCGWSLTIVVYTQCVQSANVKMEMLLLTFVYASYLAASRESWVIRWYAEADDQSATETQPRSEPEQPHATSSE